MKKIIYIVIAILVVAGAVWYFKYRQPASSPAENSGSNASVSSDNTASMSSDLNNVQVNDANFQSIDQDTNSL